MSAKQNELGRTLRSIAFALAVMFAVGWSAWARASTLAVSGLSTPGQRPPPVRLSPGYLGIDVHDVSDEQASALRLREAHGAEIVRVDHDGPAGKMGLRVHDIVLQLNGIAVEGEEPLRRMLHEMAPGRTVTLLLNREGLQVIVTAQMADRREVERDAWEQHLNGPAPQAPASGLPTGEGALAAMPGAPSSAAPSSRYSKSFLGNLMMSPSYTGAMLEIIGPQLADFFGVPGQRALLVRSVANGSPAAIAGLRAGDVVVRANAQSVGTVNEWAKQIREAKGRPVPVVVLRDKQEHTLTLIPDGKRRSSLDLPGDGSFDESIEGLPAPTEMALLLEL